MRAELRSRVPVRDSGTLGSPGSGNECWLPGARAKALGPYCAPAVLPLLRTACRQPALWGALGTEVKEAGLCLAQAGWAPAGGLTRVPPALIPCQRAGSVLEGGLAAGAHGVGWGATPHPIGCVERASGPSVNTLSLIYLTCWLMGHVSVWTLHPKLHNSQDRARPNRSTEETLGGGTRRGRGGRAGAEQAGGGLHLGRWSLDAPATPRPRPLRSALSAVALSLPR